MTNIIGKPPLWLWDCRPFLAGIHFLNQTAMSKPKSMSIIGFHQKNPQYSEGNKNISLVRQRIHPVPQGLSCLSQIPRILLHSISSFQKPEAACPMPVERSLSKCLGVILMGQLEGLKALGVILQICYLPKVRFAKQNCLVSNLGGTYTITMLFLKMRDSFLALSAIRFLGNASKPSLRYF